MKYENGLFIFRRDLRIVDNIGLLLANSKCKNVYTIFIFTPEQVSSINSFKSNNAIQFMIESLMSLENEIDKVGGKLYTFYGYNDNVIKNCIKNFDIDFVCSNYDYSPYAMERDKEIFEICKKLNIICEYEHDYYLHIPGSIKNGTGGIYQKFTPYYNSAITKRVNEPIMTKFSLSKKKSKSNLVNTITLEDAMKQFVKPRQNLNILVHGGRKNALELLKKSVIEQKHYAPTHNNLDSHTTQLSAAIKFGCISIREAFYTFKTHFGTHNDLNRQLIWRDFFANILTFYPHVLKSSMKPNYDKIRWRKNTKALNAWKTGTTGFPVVDAGMRQLNKTGYMHNRARLIVASFLTKVLGIYWKEGEKYFATKLTDYDPASNNGNWQWISGSGADSQPYFRIFNPWEQSKHYDPECNYIKEWIPELKDVEPNIIHNWDTFFQDPEFKNIKYNKPIVDYKKQKEITLDMYSSAFH
jgi:deoxyribodipyrimidine photo-lyase